MKELKFFKIGYNSLSITKEDRYYYLTLLKEDRQIFKVNFLDYTVASEHFEYWADLILAEKKA